MRIFALVITIILFSVSYGECSKIKDEVKQAEMYWLTLNVYHEARGESPKGMLMVALVTLNRQNDGRWGDTIKEVVTSPDQFSWYEDDISNIPSNKKAWLMAKKIALLAEMFYSTMSDGHDVLYYHSKNVKPKWANALIKVMVIGKHIFYKEK